MWVMAEPKEEKVETEISELYLCFLFFPLSTNGYVKVLQQ